MFAGSRLLIESRRLRRLPPCVADGQGVEVCNVPIHKRLLPEDETKLPADVLGGMVGGVDYRKQFARKRLASRGQVTLGLPRSRTESSRLRHQPVPPFQRFPTLEGEVIDACIADD